jgi:hypothetical protein
MGSVEGERKRERAMTGRGRRKGEIQILGRGA